MCIPILSVMSDRRVFAGTSSGAANMSTDVDKRVRKTHTHTDRPTFSMAAMWLSSAKAYVARHCAQHVQAWLVCV